MEIEEIKTWQWVFLGLIAGALFSCVVAWSGPRFDTQDRNTVEQGEFENNCFALTKFGQSTGSTAALYNAYYKDLPLVDDVTVHPPIASDPTHYWVTGRFYSIGLKPVDPSKLHSPSKVWGEWKLFKYPAPVPYEPGYAVLEQKKLEQYSSPHRIAQLTDLKKALGGQTRFPTVVEYLRAVQSLPENNFKFKYAWWELPRAQWSLPPFAGLLMIGIAWPLTLSALQNYGLAKRPPVKAKAKPAPVRPLSPGMNVLPAGVILNPPGPAPPPEPAEQKEYGGVYYPVVKVKHKE